MRTFIRKSVVVICLVIFQIEIAFAGECRDEDSTCLITTMMGHIILTPKYWEKRRELMHLPLEKRIIDVPPEIIDYLNLDNRLNHYTNRAQFAQPEQAFMQDFIQALQEIPENIKNIIALKLVAIMFVNDLGGSAYTELLRDEKNRAVRGFVIFDYQQLKNRTANAWATWKETSAFKPAEGYKLKMKIADDKNDTRKNAIFFIVLHELAHILCIGEDIIPAWDTHADLDKTNGAPSIFPFTEISWPGYTTAEGKKSKYDKKEFPLRPKIHFYEGSELSASEMVTTYRQLKKTDFASLYGAINPFDDFAESLTTYIHGVILKRPYEISILKNGKVLEKFDLCWSQQRCKAKKEFLEKRFNFKVIK